MYHPVPVYTRKYKSLKINNIPSFSEFPDYSVFEAMFLSFGKNVGETSAQ